MHPGRRRTIPGSNATRGRQCTKFLGELHRQWKVNIRVLNACVPLTRQVDIAWWEWPLSHRVDLDADDVQVRRLPTGS
jgi:hypothetical protein